MDFSLAVKDDILLHINRKPKVQTVLPISYLKTHHNNPKLSDIRLKVEDTTFYSHRLVLAQYPFFNSLFTNGMLESSQSVVELKDIDKETFNHVLQFLYSGKFQGSSFKLEELLELYSAADLYGIQSLKNLCQDSIRGKVVAENAISVLMFMEKVNDIQSKETCINFILQNYYDVASSESFVQLAQQQPKLFAEINREVSNHLCLPVIAGIQKCSTT